MGSTENNSSVSSSIISDNKSSKPAALDANIEDISDTSWNLNRLFHDLIKNGLEELEECKLQVDFKTLFETDLLVLKQHKSYDDYLELIKPFWSQIEQSLGDSSVKSGSYENFRATVVVQLVNVLDNKSSKKIGKKSPTRMLKNRTNILLNNTYPKRNGEFKIHIDCTPVMLNNLQIVEKAPYIACYETKYLPLWQHAPLKSRQLLNWPHIGFKLILPEVMFTHNMCNVYQRWLYLKETKRDTIVATEHDSNVSTLGNIDHRSFKRINATLLKNYLILILQVINQLSFTKRRSEELNTILDLVLSDIIATKSKSMFVDLDCVYNLSNYDYIRGYDTDRDLNNKPTPRADFSVNDKETMIVEQVTPKIKFTLNRCSFENDSVESYHVNIVRYFKDLLSNDSIAVTRFYETMKKSVIYTCILCDQKFEGLLASYGLEEHLKLVHGPEHVWTCLNCNNNFDAVYLGTNNWTHVCRFT